MYCSETFPRMKPKANQAPTPRTAASTPTGRDSLSNSAYRPLKKDPFDFSRVVGTDMGLGEYGLAVNVRLLFLEKSWWLDMSSLWAFMFALPTEMTFTAKPGTSKPRVRLFGLGGYTGRYCNCHAKKGLHDSRFQLATRFFVFNRYQRHTISNLRSSRELPWDWYPIGYRKELINSAGGKVESSRDFLPAGVCMTKATYRSLLARSASCARLLNKVKKAGG